MLSNSILMHGRCLENILNVPYSTFILLPGNMNQNQATKDEILQYRYKPTVSSSRTNKTIFQILTND